MALNAITIEDLLEELERGRVYECSLRDPHWRIDGLQDGDNVYIDPRPAIILTLLHELTHRRKRRWSERRVTKESNRLLVEMSDQQLAAWWKRYQRIKKKSRPVQTDDEE